MKKTPASSFQFPASLSGGLVIDATTLTFNQIRDITVSANTGKAEITIKHLSGLTALQLLELSALAPGLIVFDQTS